MFAVLLSIIVHFIAIRLVISTMHQHTEILLKSMQMFLRYDFFSIFWMAIGNHVELINGKILFEEGVWRTEACHHTKFVEIGPSIVEILRLFDISKWPPQPSWIFKFAKFYWLTGREGRHASLCHFAAASLHFWIREILLPDWVRVVRDASSCHLFSKLVNPLQSYCDFLNF